MDTRIAMFFSIIAYGAVFVGALMAAGIVLDKPLVLKLAVLVAGGGYVTQSVSALNLTTTAMVLWAATVVLAVSAAVMVVL